MGTHCNQVKMDRVSVLGLFLLVAAAASAKHQVERHPKLFFVSTSSTTSTIQTASVCYITTTTGFLGACTGRKRRAINFDEFKPSQMKEEVVQSSMEEKSSDRKGRFLLYWITTTSISTSITSTFSVYSVICTPSGASQC